MESPWVPIGSCGVPMCPHAPAWVPIGPHGAIQGPSGDHPGAFKCASVWRAEGLTVFLYEKHIANKFFCAQPLAKRMGLTADVMARDSQASSGYWEIVRDALADLVRIMLVRCYDQEHHPQLYNHCRNLRGEVWQCAFPNLFITIAPAEWKFPRPYFIEPYVNCVFAGALIMALHMYYLVRCVCGSS